MARNLHRALTGGCQGCGYLFRIQLWLAKDVATPWINAGVESVRMV